VLTKQLFTAARPESFWEASRSREIDDNEAKMADPVDGDDVSFIISKLGSLYVLRSSIADSQQHSFSRVSANKIQRSWKRRPKKLHGGKLLKMQRRQRLLGSWYARSLFGKTGG
jgi:hypothetical protein